MSGVAAVAIAALIVSALLTGVVRRVARRWELLDIPNPRSSHLAPTPRGGGLAIVLTAAAALGALAWTGLMDLRLLWALLGGGSAVAAVGLADDRRPIRAGVRLSVHVLAALWAVCWLGGLPSIDLGVLSAKLGWLGDALAVLGIVWTLNLFNFMDGIDGIAVSEAVFVMCAALPCMATLGVTQGVGAASLAIAAASLGFLAWNWPPARIFLGDVGSGYLGYVIAVLALAAAGARPTALWSWLILGGVFFVDATVTLIRRFARGEPPHQAHRSHAYQWLARRWRSHLRVTTAVVALNLLWLFPCAWYAALHPAQAALTTLLAFVPLVALALVAGSGRSEHPHRAAP